MFLFHFHSFMEKIRLYYLCMIYALLGKADQKSRSVHHSEMFIGENNIKAFLTVVSRVDVSVDF